MFQRNMRSKQKLHWSNINVIFMLQYCFKFILRNINILKGNLLVIVVVILREGKRQCRHNTWVFGWNVFRRSKPRNWQTYVMPWWLISDRSTNSSSFVQISVRVGWLTLRVVAIQPANSACWQPIHVVKTDWFTRWFLYTSFFIIACRTMYLGQCYVLDLSTCDRKITR